MSTVSQAPVIEEAHSFPVRTDWDDGSKYSPSDKGLSRPSLLGVYISTRCNGLEAILNNYAPIFSKRPMDADTIRFFEDIPEEKKNDDEKCVRDKFDPMKAAANDIFCDLSRFSVNNKVLMSQQSIKSSLNYTLEQKQSVCNLIQFVKLSKTIQDDALIVSNMKNDADVAEKCLRAALLPTDCDDVSTLIDMFCQKAPRDVFLASETKCCIDGCLKEEHDQLFKVNSVCSNHQSCIDARMNEKNCHCTAAYCKHCLCNHMAKLYKVCKPAVCATCNAEFCPEDLILYNVLAKPVAKEIQVASASIEVQPKKRAKRC